MRTNPSIGILTATLAACGGKVFLDGDTGTGGATTASASSSAATTASGTGGALVSGTSGAVVGGAGGAPANDCEALTQLYQQALAAAAACDVCDPFDPCPNGPQLPDMCGCPVGLAGDFGLIAKAKDAYAAWNGAGCGPVLCGTPCAAPLEWHCKPIGNCAGVCSP
jgi:hypothetical protein